MKINLILTFIALNVIGSSFAQINPQQKFGELFQNIQQSEIFRDQKTFVDCNPKINPDSILKFYHNQKDNPDFHLKTFVGKYFDTLQTDTTSLLRHLNYLWSDLTRKADANNKYSSLLPLPHPYIVPGGRFKEIYYWDSYFTMLGLQVSGKTKLIEDMVNNFDYLIKTYAHIPNGNRTYYLSRSQPPFFALMVKLLAETKSDDSIYLRYLSSIEKEYDYWMSGKKVIHLSEKDVLNCYHDEANTPRPEAYLHDQKIYLKSQRDSSIFRDLRSAAESGWDFSTRWFEDGKSLTTIITTQIIPVDLNSLLYNLENTLALAYKIKKDQKKSALYSSLALKRKSLINKYCWNEEKGYYFDYDYITGRQTPNYTLAGLFPLYFKLSSENQAVKVKKVIETDFLKPGGLVTTLAEGSGQQWDYPNAWAPLQWIGYIAFKNYNFNSTAYTIAKRWTDLNIKVYFETGKMMEKYNVVDINKPGGGGEYKTQDGFGWTNGVFLKMWSEIKNNKNQK